MVASGAGAAASAVAGAGAGAGSLRRRNSDPAPCEPRAPDPRSTDYIGQTGNGLFRIAGHRYFSRFKHMYGPVTHSCDELQDTIANSALSEQKKRALVVRLASRFAARARL